MEQTLPLPFIQPSQAVLARIKEFARKYRPQSFTSSPNFVLP
jgi:hypothetical protein